MIHAIMSAVFMHLCIHASLQLLFLSSFQALPNPQLEGQKHIQAVIKGI